MEPNKKKDVKVVGGKMPMGKTETKIVAHTQRADPENVKIVSSHRSEDDN